MHYIVKLFFIRLYGFFLRFVFSIFPLKRNTVVFISFDGLRIACNPYYLYLYIKENDDRFNCYWVIDHRSKARNIPEDMIIIKGSYKYFLYMHTSQFIVTNDRFSSFFRFRKDQVLINTWHGGGAFKRTFGYPKGTMKWYLDNTTKMDSNRTSIFLSSSERWTEVIARKSFYYHGEVLRSGFPRNDVFFVDNSNKNKHIKNSLGINEEDIIVLYAPTYRPQSQGANNSIENIDVQKVKETVSKKYKKACHFLYRGHHLMLHDGALGECIDVSDYPDMQELLLIADVLISDYSSCLWDFSLTYRPCFIYAPDFKQYALNPGFESDYKEWPFIIVYNNDELELAIINFDEDSFVERAKLYHQLYGSYDKGDASKIVLARMQDIVGAF